MLTAWKGILNTSQKTVRLVFFVLQIAGKEMSSDSHVIRFSGTRNSTLEYRADYQAVQKKEPMNHLESLVQWLEIAGPHRVK